VVIGKAQEDGAVDGKRSGRARVPRIVAAALGIVVLFGGAGVLWLRAEFRRPLPTTGPRIYTAATIVTMNPARPRATAVAVDGGRIVAVGTLDEVRRQTGSVTPSVDERFADKVLVPGFIDPHLHPSLAATILPLNIVSAMEWMTPRGRSIAVHGHEAFVERLRELDRGMSDDDEWLLVWGYHRPYHGELSRAELDRVSSTRPIMVWQRSVHEMYFNSAGLARLGLTAEDFAGEDQADWETGHIWEAALFSLARPMMNILASPSTYRKGLRMMREVIHRGGLTTVAEQGFPQISKFGELLLLHLEMRAPDPPFRFVLVPNAMFLLRQHGKADEAEAAAKALLDWSTERIQVVKRAKYYADGAIFSQLMQMSEPYLDGHHGEWMMPPEQQRNVLRAFWREGWDVHIHVNGDAGLDVVLDHVRQQRDEHPDEQKRVVLEHYGYAREDQHVRLKNLGVAVSNNAYYLHELAPIYAEHGLGPERAGDISPLGGLARAGVRFSFHSDFPMAPAEPLKLVWVAVNRLGSDGKVWGEDQKISVDLALRAVTSEAAWSLGLEKEIGSIAVGKKADFTVLEQDPYVGDPVDIKDIPIWGTVLEGRPHPIAPGG
jgi:predicted amidohydrolase YtcJ